MLPTIAYILELLTQNLYDISIYDIYNHNLNTIPKLRAYHTKMHELKKIYDNYLQEYAKLAKVFNFGNPIEIYAMFRYCLEKGYLSENGQFSFENIDKELTNFDGTHVIEGHASCRHIAPMLSDVLRTFNLKSYNLTIYARELINVSTNISQNKNYNSNPLNVLHLLIRLGMSPEEIEKIIKHSNNFTNSLEIKAEYQKYENPIGNHMITIVEYNGLGYLLDASKNCIYFIDQEKNILNSYRLIGHIIPDEIKWANVKHPIGAKEVLKLPNEPINKSYNQAEQVTFLCDLNQDLLINFNHENHELISEIAHKTRELVRQK